MKVWNSTSWRSPWTPWGSSSREPASGPCQRVPPPSCPSRYNCSQVRRKYLRHPVEFFIHLKPFQHESNVVREDCQEVHHVERGFQEGDLELYWRRNNFCYWSKLTILLWCKIILEMKNLFWRTGKTNQEFWGKNHLLVYFMLKQNWGTSSRSKEEITLMNLLIT